MQYLSLEGWLEKIQAVHVTDMDLSLERVFEVARRLNLLKPSCPVITVGGTNGKGSCVAGLEAIYLSAGYRVGAFTSPILFRHNEYVRVQGKEVTDEEFCEAFRKIDHARGDITLTPFEFNALAAFEIFTRADLDVWILEVGLGGRFDAVNVMDPDVAVVASVGIDHTEWLGDTREKIAFEKAGIFRSGKSAICGDFDVPVSMKAYAQKIGAPLFCQDRHFGFEKKSQSWNWWSEKNNFENLPLSKLALQNMATVLMVVELLQEKLAVSREKISAALAKVTLPGRIQVFPGDVTKIFDVSHNPAAAEFLANWLSENPCYGKTRAVFSMLADKDIFGTVRVMQDRIDEWHVASLLIKRGASIEKIQQAFQEMLNVNSYSSITEAYGKACENSKLGDRIVVFGSFYTVSEVSNNFSSYFEVEHCG